MAILKVRNLTKKFTSGMWPFSTPHTYTAVNGISFEVHQGEIVGFLGPNGAGKTTTIQMLLGALTPTDGSILYFGRDLQQHRIAALRKLGYASGYDRLPARLTVLENLDIIGRIYGLSSVQRNECIEKSLKTFKMWDMRHKQTGTLSAGQTTRVMLAKAFLVNPEIVLLDEPTASLDPDIAHEVRQFILMQRKERNISLLITSHNMDEVTELCDRVLVLKKGVIIANNTPEQLAQSTSKVRMTLMISSDLGSALTYFNNAQMSCAVNGAQVVLDLDEQKIAQLLAQLGSNGIMYCQISIDKPTLDDYFLSISRGEL